MDPKRETEHDEDDMQGHSTVAPTSMGGRKAKDDDDVEGHAFIASGGTKPKVGAGARDEDDDVEGHAFIASGGTSRSGTSRG